MRRVIVPLLIALIASTLAPAPAHAWSNGTAGCNSYGTHDWILDQALQAVGEEADWVRTP